MELNAYALELDAHDRLATARAVAARRRLARDGSARPGLRVRVGAVLIRLGTWIQGCAHGAAPIPRKRLSPG